MAPWVDIRPVPCNLPPVARRKNEGEAWRAIVREHLGLHTAISYAPNGVPILEKGLGHIGVSHTDGWVAVVWSPEPCAIDVELKTRKISPRAAARMGIPPNISAWCAWEATYKYKSAASIEAALSNKPIEIPPVSFRPHPDLVVAVIL